MLPKPFRPYAKAVCPFLASLAAVGIQWALTGTYDSAELHTQAMGLLGAVLTFVTTNRGA